jgi:uncharacterized membrane protein
VALAERTVSNDGRLQSTLPDRAGGSEPLRGRDRIQSIDVLRGLVIALMVLDHVRDWLHESGYAFSPLDPDRTTALLYVTRWVTNFCAPTFVFLAGVSVWLQVAKGKSRGELALRLVTRGLWLIALELTVVSFGWSFSMPFLIFLQVIWAIGWSMIVLAALVWLPRPAVLACGVAILVVHDVLDGVTAAVAGPFSKIYTFLNVGGAMLLGGFRAYDGYPVLAWMGVMLWGYGMGEVFLGEERRRRRVFVTVGLSLIAGFLALRYFNLYGDPHPWVRQGDARRTLMAFFAVEKYPPSLLYVCATLGPVLAAIPLIERWRGAAARVLLTFGSVPLFAYLVHIYIAHLLAILADVIYGANVSGQFNVLSKALFAPETMAGTGLPLYVTYAVWVLVLAILYPLCRWFCALRRRRSDWWLSYL